MPNEVADFSLEMAEERLRIFLEQQLLVDFDIDVSRESDLFREGLLDSYGYIEVMRFIETAFDVTIGDEEMLLGIEVSLAGLAGFAHRKWVETH